MGVLQDLSEMLAVQTAVYWGNPVDDGYGGFDYDDPDEIFCAWYDTTEVITDRAGQERVCRAKVIVTQDLDDRGILYLGTLDDLDSSQEANPSKVDSAYPIRRIDKIPMVMETDDFFRMVYL